MFKVIERNTYSEIILGKNVHDNLKEKTNSELKDLVKLDRFSFHVIAINLTGDLNIGTIIRSSILHGAEKVWIFGRRKYDKRGAVGSQNYIDVEKIYGFEEKDSLTFDVEEFKKLVDQNGLIPVFVEQGGISLEKFDWDFDTQGKKIALVLGNETNGIPEDFIEEDDYLVSIPQRGVIRSFNVSSAMNIVTWDLRKAKKWF